MLKSPHSHKTAAKVCFNTCSLTTCPSKQDKKRPCATVPFEKFEDLVPERFRHRTMCDHKECQPHARYGVIDVEMRSKCVGELRTPSIYLDNVMDLANTLAHIIVVCGVDKCQAKCSIDVIVGALMHSDLECYSMMFKPKKHIRKNEVMANLRRRCHLNIAETKLAYKIIQPGFNAFHYDPTTSTDNNDRDDDDNGFQSLETLSGNVLPTPAQMDCVFMHAAKKTVRNVAALETLSCEQHRFIDYEIRELYKQLVDRMKQRKYTLDRKDCNCLVCVEKRGCFVEVKKSKHYCRSYCVAKSKRRFLNTAIVSLTPISSLHTSQISWADRSGLYSVSPVSTFEMSTLNGPPSYCMALSSIISSYRLSGISDVPSIIDKNYMAGIGVHHRDQAEMLGSSTIDDEGDNMINGEDDVLLSGDSAIEEPTSAAEEKELIE